MLGLDPVENLEMRAWSEPDGAGGDGLIRALGHSRSVGLNGYYVVVVSLVAIHHSINCSVELSWSFCFFHLSFSSSFFFFSIFFLLLGLSLH